jgi:hypothetical protein
MVKDIMNGSDYNVVSMSKSFSEVARSPFTIFLSITLMASKMLGINRVPSQDPTAIVTVKALDGRGGEDVFTWILIVWTTRGVVIKSCKPS